MAIQIRTVLISITLVYCSQVAYAQSVIDSLQNQLQKELPDSSRVLTLIEFFNTDLYYDNPELVIDYTHQAISLSEKTNYYKGLAEACNILGYIYRIRSENDSAFYYYRRAENVSFEADYYEGRLDAHMGIGNTYIRLQKYDSAQLQFDEALSVATSANDTISLASTYNNVANIYLSESELDKALEHYQLAAKYGDASIREVATINIGLVHIRLGNYEKAREYYEQAIDMAISLGNEYHLAFIYKNLGIIEKQTNNFEKALQYYNQALTGFHKVSDRYAEAELLGNIGNVYFEKEKYAKAIEHYDKALQIQQEIGASYGACFNLIALGQSHTKLKQFQTAERVLMDADVIADSIQILAAKMDIAESLSYLYQTQGKYQDALKYQISFKQLNDSLVSLQNERQIADLESTFQAAEKQKEIELLSAENEIANLNIETKDNLRNYLIIIALILIILVVVVYNRFQVKAKANVRLKELDQLKTTFFTNISHEFRTPLSLILSPLQRLFSQKEVVKIRPELTTIYKNANHLLSLTNQILDLSKLEAGKLRLNVSERDLGEFLRVTAASFESLANEKNISFSIALEDNLVAVYFDEDKLQKAVNNLLSNAFKFTPSSGEIELSALDRGKNVEISIMDSGPGLTEEEKQSVFERYYQGDRTTGHALGTGIGLTLTKELISLHHGSIRVISEKDKGSTFIISFPKNRDGYELPDIQHGSKSESIHQSVEATSFETTVDYEKSEGGGPIVLVVEDNKDLRDHMAQLLNDNYRVHTAINGQDGLKLAFELIPDLIVSDLMMPEMDGVEMCNQIKQNQKTSHVPFILLTAKADKDSKLDGLKTGADDYLTKPFDNDEILQRIQNLIQLRVKLREQFSQIVRFAPSEVEVKDPNSEFIKRAISVVENHLGDTDFTVELFQQEMAMSRMQLHRKLKALTDFSANEFIRDLRLQRAADLIKSNSISVSEAAYSCGFNSLSYFAQCFKEKFGSTPSKYFSRT